jgi:glycosyltransferase involved in cell wall biosynthesis/SAM-dependent methyltransferase
MFLTGMRKAGITVYECHQPIWQGMRDKTNAYRGLMLVKMLLRVVIAYVLLTVRYLRMPAHDVMMVGYIGHGDMLLARLLAWVRGVPLVFNITLSLYDTFVSGRSLVKEHSLTGWLFWLLDFVSSHAADLLITDTQSYADYFVQTFGVAPERCCVVPLGANDQLFTPTPSPVHQHNTTTCEVLFVGKFIPLHGCETIVRAAHLLRDKPIHITMIGDGQDFPLVQRLIDELALENITLTGWVDYADLPSYVAKADVCLGNFGTSARAGRAISNKVYESMAMRLPVLSGDTPGLRSQLAIGEEVWACRVGDAEDMAQQLACLADDPALRQRLADTGYAAFQQRYTVLAIGQRIASCLARVVDSTAMGGLLASGERMLPAGSHSTTEEQLAYLRHMTAYDYAIDQIPQTGAKLVLDLGCGEGYGTHHLATTARVETVIGLDVAPDAVMHAAAQYLTEDCQFGVYNGLVLPFPDESLDAVMAFQVIEHVQNDALFVREVYRVLKPGGIFLATTPDRSYRLKPGQKPWNRYHIREYAADDLEQVLSSAFAEVQVLHVCGTERVYQMEWKRVQWARKMAALDPLALRERVPERTLPMLRALLKRATQHETTTNDTPDLATDSQAYSQDDFCVQATSDNSLDLLGVCSKR